MSMVGYDITRWLKSLIQYAEMIFKSKLSPKRVKKENKTSKIHDAEEELLNVGPLYDEVQHSINQKVFEE